MKPKYNSISAVCSGSGLGLGLGSGLGLGLGLCRTRGPSDVKINSLDLLVRHIIIFCSFAAQPVARHHMAVSWRI